MDPLVVTSFSAREVKTLVLSMVSRSVLAGTSAAMLPRNLNKKQMKKPRG